VWLLVIVFNFMELVGFVYLLWTDEEFTSLFYTGYEFCSSDVAACNEKGRGRLLDAGSAG